MAFRQKKTVTVSQWDLAPVENETIIVWERRPTPPVLGTSLKDHPVSVALYSPPVVLLKTSNLEPLP